MTVAFSAGDVAYWALAIFLVLLGVGSIFALFKLGQLFDRLSSLVQGTERDALPVVVKTGGTVDRVNYQLDKLDTVTDSAVSMADSADTAVRAVSTAITTPVEKVSGFAAGIAHGVSSFRKSRNFSEATDAAKDAARRREQDLAEDLRVAGRTPPSARAADTDADTRRRSPSPIRGRSRRRRRSRIRRRCRRTSSPSAAVSIGREAWLAVLRRTSVTHAGLSFVAFHDSVPEARSSRHRVGTKSWHSRATSTDSLTPGTRECPWGWLSGLSRPAGSCNDRRPQTASALRSADARQPPSSARDSSPSSRSATTCGSRRSR